MIEDFALKAERVNANVAESESVGLAWSIMPPEIMQALMRYMKDSGLSWDVLTADLLRNNSVLAGRIQYRGRLKGIDLFSWNGISVPTGTGNWTGLNGMREGAFANVRSVVAQFFEPSVNQVSTMPAHLLRQAGDYAWVEGLEELFTAWTIEAD